MFSWMEGVLNIAFVILCVPFLSYVYFAVAGSQSTAEVGACDDDRAPADDGTGVFRTGAAGCYGERVSLALDRPIASRIALPTFRCGLTMPKSSPGQAWWPHQDSRFVKTPSYEMENKKFDRICPE
jgi:hypothetical protein